MAASIAADLVCRLRLLCLDLALAEPEPKTMRYQILDTAARIVHGQCKRKIKIPETWPCAHELAAEFHAVFALTAPPDPTRLNRESSSSRETVLDAALEWAVLWRRRNCEAAVVIKSTYGLLDLRLYLSR